MADLNVVCFKFNGWRNEYTADHVNKLYRGVSRYLSLPHRFVCITDEPVGIECETFPLWDFPKVNGHGIRQDCYMRLRMFSPWAAEQWPGHVLMLDLDAVVCDWLDPLITHDDFRILEGASSTPYNGSMWLHKTGTRTDAWEKFDPETSPQLALSMKTGNRPWRGSDQSYLSMALPGENTYSTADGVYQSGKSGIALRPFNARLVFFPGFVKPWHPEALTLTPWAARIWRET